MNEYGAVFSPENVRAFRKKQGMTQQEFADKIGVSQATVSKAERNPEYLSLNYLVKMQQAFNLVVEKPKFEKKRWWERIFRR